VCSIAAGSNSTSPPWCLPVGKHFDVDFTSLHDITLLPSILQFKVHKTPDLLRWRVSPTNEPPLPTLAELAAQAPTLAEVSANASNRARTAEADRVAYDEEQKAIIVT